MGRPDVVPVARTSGNDAVSLPPVAPAIAPLRVASAVDDVITAGTAIRESIDIIKAAGAQAAGVLLALLSRAEKGE